VVFERNIPCYARLLNELLETDVENYELFENEWTDI